MCCASEQEDDVQSYKIDLSVLKGGDVAFLLILRLEQSPDVQYFSERSHRLLVRVEDDGQSEKVTVQKEVTGMFLLERFTPNVQYQIAECDGQQSIFFAQ